MTRTAAHSPDIENWLKLAHTENVGAVTFAKLIKHFGTVQAVFEASVSELQKIEGIGAKKAERIVATRGKFDAAAELQLAEKLGVWIINIADDRYPAVLKRIYDPPPVLYIKGTLSSSDNLGVAIVGSRRCSLYGQEQASRFAYLLSSAGFTICSGMARGIDTAAHQGALSAKGRTIAVQGCGLGHVFPPENKKLFELICESGACVSELPLNYEPLSENFPGRNRIIAGLSLGTIVIEAAKHSGALITASAAMENNREVMAIPGKIDSPLNAGTHQLIKEGARLIDSVDDVVDALGYIGERLKDHVADSAACAAEEIDAPVLDLSQLKLSDREKIIYDCLTRDPIHMECLIAETDLPPGSISSALISLRLKGLIKQIPGNYFAKR